MTEHRIAPLTVAVRRDFLVGLLGRLGTKGMTHNGHIPPCLYSYHDWLATDPCTCGRDEAIKELTGLLSGRLNHGGSFGEQFDALMGQIPESSLVRMPEEAFDDD